LRGSSPGYGFPSIGQAAGRVEEAIRLLPAHQKAAPTPEDLALQEIAQSVDELLSLCRRAAG
jgi:hypothetical protein